MEFIYSQQINPEKTFSPESNVFGLRRIPLGNLIETELHNEDSLHSGYYSTNKDNLEAQKHQLFGICELIQVKVSFLNKNLNF